MIIIGILAVMAIALIIGTTEAGNGSLCLSLHTMNGNVGINY